MITITPDEFKSHFKSDFPYLPVYINGHAYFKGDVVYWTDENFYKSLTDGNITEPSDTANWILTKKDINSYVTDDDINKALAEALVNFNEGLFPDEATAKLVLMYLVAFYLTLDRRNATGAGSNFGFMQSKSVGNVAISYGLPQWLLNNPMMGIYASNGYGLKYLSLIYPYLHGQIIVCQGRTTFN